MPFERKQIRADIDFDNSACPGNRLLQPRLSSFSAATVIRRLPLQEVQQLWRLVSTVKHQAVDSTVPSVLPPRGRLIHHQPVDAEMPRRIDKLIEVDRFADEAVGAKVVT